MGFLYGVGGFMAKLTYQDLLSFLDEVELGAQNKSRTINDITNPTVKKLVMEESSVAIQSGVTAALIASGTLATSSIIGVFGGAGVGAISSSITALGVGTVSMASGIAIGGTAGSAVPVVGTIAGAIVGAGVGIFVGKRIQKKNDNKKETLKQETIAKQNRVIKDLEIELEELKKQFAEAVEQNERYKYIIGILMGFEEFKSAFN